MIIASFTNQYRFLSNFFVEPDGSHVEGEYQSAKHILQTNLLRDQYPINLCRDMTPGQAKRWGKRIPLRPDWEQVKLEVMEKFVLNKFLDHAELADNLLATGDIELIEGNHWGDRFWGQCLGTGE